MTRSFIHHKIIPIDLHIALFLCKKLGKIKSKTST
jgi:hypothetical protein